MSLSDFITLSKLGDGSYSSVYKAQRRKDGKIYALKQVAVGRLSNKERTNALNEVRLLASFRHPNIVGYKEAFVDEASETLCIVMEYADGGDLYQRIAQRRTRPFGEDFVWNVLVQVLRALSALHSFNIMHRDLKSANVFLFSDGRVKLGDFNVSKVSHQGLLFTQTGTPYYASPEVWKEHPYSAKSDIWSLGCVIYETAALRPPFYAGDMESLYKKVVKGEFARMPQQFSQDLNEVVGSMLKVDPDKRPSCDDLLRSSALYQRVPYQKDPLEDCELLDTIYAPEDVLKMDVGRLPRARYWEEGKGTAGRFPRIQPQIASIHRSFPSPSRKPSVPRPVRLDHFSPEPDLSLLSHKRIMMDQYGALQPLRRQRTGREAFLDHSMEAPKNPIISDRCDRILDSYKRSKAVVDMLRTPNRKRPADQLLYS